ncbi:MAG: pyridoxamine 5'-phosphate oxidase family protein [Deltaproteobacteria bacterium]|nr:pyridoxamine 5'-phosphate oxidase family protein [Deltaproteobacteria bacterium]
MSQLLGKELTEELFNRLKGDDVASKMGKAIVIVTVDDNGWAHPAMLSYYEVVAKDRLRIDLAIGKTSTTGKNLRRTGKITLLITDSGINYYLKGSARELRESMEGVSFMSLFRVETEELLEDQEPDAVITSGVTFSRPQKKEVGEIIEKIFQGVKKEPF